MFALFLIWVTQASIAQASEGLCPREADRFIFSSAQTNEFSEDWVPLSQAEDRLEIVKRNLTRFDDGLWFSTLGYDRQLIDYVSTWEMKKMVKSFFEFSLYDFMVKPQDIRMDWIEETLVYPLSFTLYYRDFKHTEIARRLGNRPRGPSSEIYFQGQMRLFFEGDQLRLEARVVELTDQTALWGSIPLGALLRERVFRDEAAGPLCDYISEVIEPVLEGFLSRPEQLESLILLAQNQVPEFAIWAARWQRLAEALPGDRGHEYKPRQ